MKQTLQDKEFAQQAAQVSFVMFPDTSIYTDTPNIELVYIEHIQKLIAVYKSLSINFAFFCTTAMELKIKAIQGT